ncbi:MAG: hypothetical protein RI894_1662 [Bacteroidota bacterium]|jgi:hypothetical protein
MDDWQLEAEWNWARNWVKEALSLEKTPDMNAILFLIGIQELGRPQDKFSKEEKQDLMHLAICRLLEYDGYYEFVARDADGWPHYELRDVVAVKGENEQERLLKKNVVRYFKEWEIADN